MRGIGEMRRRLIEFGLTLGLAATVLLRLWQKTVFFLPSSPVAL